MLQRIVIAAARQAIRLSCYGKAFELIRTMSLALACMVTPFVILRHFRTHNLPTCDSYWKGRARPSRSPLPIVLSCGLRWRLIVVFFVVARPDDLLGFRIGPEGPHRIGLCQGIVLSVPVISSKEFTLNSIPFFLVINSEVSKG